MKEDNEIKKNKVKRILKRKNNKASIEETVNYSTLFDSLLLDENKIYPVIVVSNISSGKSTLINALLGKELLPSKNQVCTAKSVGILDNDRLDYFRIHMVDKEDNYEVVSKDTYEKVRDYNENNDIKEIIVEGNIKGIINSQKALFIIDTPGMNNALDSSHQEITINTIRQISEGLLLYVFDAGHLSTYDDEKSLKLISMALKKRHIKVIFIVNRMDIVDSEKGNPMDMLLNLRDNLQRYGFDKPVIVPVSALCALLVKKVINKEKLTKGDWINLSSFLTIFKSPSGSLSDLFIDENFEDMNTKYLVNDECILKKDLLRILENSGWMKLENLINSFVVSQCTIGAPTVEFK